MIPNTIIDYTVATENDRAKLDTKLNDVVKVLNDGQSKWVLYKNTNSSTDSYEIIGQENATIKFKTTFEPKNLFFENLVSPLKTITGYLDTKNMKNGCLKGNRRKNERTD